MLDVSFTELLVVGVVALVVIGPERLPKVARTIGHLVGRAQRYVSDVKSDIKREVELDGLRDLKGQMEEAARSVKSSLHHTEESIRHPIESIQQDALAGLNGPGDVASPYVSLTDSASASAQVDAATPYHAIAPYVSVGSDTSLVRPYKTISVVVPYKTITAVTATPGSDT
jgi:sec-independent protein translocase protein TatB